MSNSISSNAAVPSMPYTAESSASMSTAAIQATADLPPTKTQKPRLHVCGTCQRSFARSEHRPNPFKGPKLSMRPRKNAISHIDSSTMQPIAAANTSVPDGNPPSHQPSRHVSLTGLSIHNSDLGMLEAMGPREVQQVLPEPKPGTGNLDFSNGLQTTHPNAAFNTKFDFESLFGPGSMINSDIRHCDLSPQSTAMEQAPMFVALTNEMPAKQTLDDRLDGYSSSANSTTNRNGTSHITPGGSGHPSWAGTSIIG
uniref:Uncharacterized protein n=1 Tax=Fusarium oxysporum (strain Fo5176) TaxID=660025 RepID=A0A0D2XS79_FUSOF